MFGGTWLAGHVRAIKIGLYTVLALSDPPGLWYEIVLVLTTIKSTLLPYSNDGRSAVALSPKKPAAVPS